MCDSPQRGERSSGGELWSQEERGGLKQIQVDVIDHLSPTLTQYFSCYNESTNFYQNLSHEALVSIENKGLFGLEWTSVDPTVFYSLRTKPGGQKE